MKAKIAILVLVLAASALAVTYTVPKEKQAVLITRAELERRLGREEFYEWLFSLFNQHDGSEYFRGRKEVLQGLIQYVDDQFRVEPPDDTQNN